MAMAEGEREAGESPNPTDRDWLWLLFEITLLQSNNIYYRINCWDYWNVPRQFHRNKSPKHPITTTNCYTHFLLNHHNHSHRHRHHLFPVAQCQNYQWPMVVINVWEAHWQGDQSELPERMRGLTGVCGMCRIEPPRSYKHLGRVVSYFLIGWSVM